MDLKEPFTLPSEGKIYKVKMNPEFTIRAPRLCDKGIGDLRLKNRVQADVLKKILDPTPEVDPYDWHTSDFTAANLAERLVSLGNLMEIMVTCRVCGHSQKVVVDLSKVKSTKPKLPLDLTYNAKNGDTIELRYFTPRILDSIRNNIEAFKDEYPDATQDVELQETVRALIVSINGDKPTYSQLTNYILNSYEVDLFGIIDKAISTNFGPVLTQKMKCGNRKCQATITYSISPDRG